MSDDEELNFNAINNAADKAEEVKEKAKLDAVDK